MIYPLPSVQEMSTFQLETCIQLYQMKRTLCVNNFLVCRVVKRITGRSYQTSLTVTLLEKRSSLFLLLAKDMLFTVVGVLTSVS